MGVDMSVQVGAGFVIPEAALKKYLEVSDPDDDGAYETLWRDIENYPGLTIGCGGSYYDSVEPEYWVAAERITQEVAERRSGNGGVLQLGSLMLSEDEGRELVKFAEDIGVEGYEIGPFVSVLWS